LLATIYAIRENNLYLPKKIQKAAHTFIEKDYDKVVLGSLIVAIVAGILLKYGDGLLG